MIIKVKFEGVQKAKKAGAKVVKIYLDSTYHKSYEGRKKRPDDYFYGYKAICDNDELICLVCDNPEINP